MESVKMTQDQFDSFIEYLHNLFVYHEKTQELAYDKNELSHAVDGFLDSQDS